MQQIFQNFFIFRQPTYFTDGELTFSSSVDVSGCRITGAVVSSDPVVTGSAVLTRIRFTFVNFLFAMRSYKGNNSLISGGFTICQTVCSKTKEKAGYFGIIFITSFDRALALDGWRMGSIV